MLVPMPYGSKPAASFFVLGLFSRLATGHICWREDAPQWTTQDHDGDLVSLLQAVPRISASAKVPSDWHVSERQVSFSDNSMPNSSLRIKGPVIVASAKPAKVPPGRLGLLERSITRNGSGNAWVFAVVLAAVTLVLVALYTCVTIRSDAPQSGKTDTPTNQRNAAQTPPMEAFIANTRMMPAKLPPTAVASTSRNIQDQPVFEQSLSRSNPDEGSRPATQQLLRSRQLAQPKQRGESRHQGAPYGAAQQDVSRMISPGRYDGGFQPRPLCESIMLPQSMCRFAAELTTVAYAEPDSEIQISEINLGEVFRLRVSAERLDVFLSSDAPGIQPRCSIVVPASDNPSSFDIQGARETPYGHFLQLYEHTNEVFIQNHKVLKVSGTPKDMDFKVTTPSGKHVAKAGVKKDSQSVDNFEVEVEAGYDAVLIIAVVMAITIFVQ
jgi:hypothetical protein